MVDRIQPEHDGRHDDTRPVAERDPAIPTPTQSARRDWQAAGRQRRFAAAYVAVALVALAAGIGATLLALRYMPRAQQSPASAPAVAATSGEQHAGHDGGPSANAPAAGDQAKSDGGKRVYISPARQQLIGVRTAEVTHQALDTTIRTVGVIAYDERRVAEIHTKIAGWVERVSVNFVGKQVRKGQPLFTIYSPDLVATQREYLLALRADRQLSGSQIAETREGARSLLAATRERLRLWDVTDAQIEQLARSGEPRRTLTVYSPFTGIVLERNAFRVSTFRPRPRPSRSPTSRRSGSSARSSSTSSAC